ncbi:MAG: outer membrane beta-barrel protein [Pseudomonadota bacterium]
MSNSASFIGDEKMFRVGVLTIIFMGSWQSAFALDWYLKGSALYVEPKSTDVEINNPDSGTSFSLPVGYRDHWGGSLGGGVSLPAAPVRLEAEVLHFRGETDSGAICGSIVCDSRKTADTTTIMANVYADLRVAPFAAFYSGLGVGAATPELDVRESGLEDENDFVPAYQIMAGVRFDVVPSVTVFGGYRYLSVRDIEFRTEFFEGDVMPDISTDLNNHSAEVGILIWF